MNVMPLRDFVVVSKDSSDRTTASGLHLVSIEEKVVTGQVQAVGSGRVVDGVIVPLEVKVGDKVAFNKNMAIEFKVGDSTMLLLREDQLYCVVKE